MNHEAIVAVRKLAGMGYRFTVNGETIKAKYEGPGKPDPYPYPPGILQRNHRGGRGGICSLC
ncbi:MAG: hypothetical protein KKD99_10075 [Proteobacteria bacterium]|nr:hypothetical protein [Pseudomonadota bacterium]MBU4357496.1 hypothetical protein [Pseudomonadota bacterium]MBU4448924.1 hypothetical protein [Pseudomonadota bacterium]